MERDLLKEKKAIEQFQLRTGRDPNPVDLQDLYKSIYGGQLPLELQNTQFASGSTLNVLKGTSTPGAALPALESNLGAAQQRVGALSRPNTALNTLQEAIKMKTGAAQAPVGTSDIFAKAGVTGYGALSQSLAARRDEIGKDINDYKDVVNNMAGIYRDESNAALQEMEAAYNLYTNEVSRIDKLNETILSHKNAIELQKIKEEADKQLAAYRSQLTREEKLYDVQVEKGAINLFTGEYNLPSDVDSVANAIKQIESGGNYKARGAAGEIGAYQIMPQNWYNWSREYQKATGVIPSATPENQDAVAKFKLQQLLAQGLPPQDIAAIWNSGAVRKNEQGQYVNTKGVTNVQRYVEKFTRVLTQQRKATMTTVTDGLQAVNVWLTKQQQESLTIAVNDRLLRGDEDGAKSLILQGAISALPVEQKNKAFGRNEALAALDNIENLINQYKNEGGNTGIIVGSAEKIAEKIGGMTNATLARMANDIMLAIVDYRRAVSGAAFTESEAKVYEALFPNIGNIPELNEQKIESLKSSFNRNQKSNLSTILGGSTYDALTKKETYPIGTIVEVNGKRYKSLGNNNFEPI